MKEVRLSFRWMQQLIARIVVVSSSLLLVSCPPIKQSKVVPVVPMCTLSSVIFESNPKDDLVLVAERTDTSVDHGFTAFRAISSPVGNPAIGFTQDVYGFGEAWLRSPAGPEVFRAQVTPARRRNATTGFDGSAWSIEAQDASGTWSPVFGAGSANREEIDDPAAGGLTVPQLMPVGLSNPEMFACAGERTEDHADSSTWLIEATAPDIAKKTSGTVMFIQDMLNGDDRFVPNAPGPLTGPSNPPTPKVSGPGNPIRSGFVQCAMLQTGDDVSTRELHMLAIDHGTLYHSMASNFGPVTSGSGSFTFNRFRTVTPWNNLGQALGGGFGNVISASIVASRPKAISVFFVAGSGGLYRLWHAVRFSTTGLWRPPDDVLRLSGDASAGTVYPWQVSANACPPLGATEWTTQNTELLIALWGTGPNPAEVVVIRVLSTPMDFRPTVTGIYSPLRSLLLPNSDAAARNTKVANVVVSARPFRDNAVPPP
jgi:hypothetical protein